MAITASLKELSIPDALQLLDSQKGDGILRITNTFMDRFDIVLSNGNIINVAYKNKFLDEMTLEYLLKIGKIKKEKYEQILNIKKTSRGNLETILKEIFNQNLLLKSGKLVLENFLNRVLRIEDGKLEFKQKSNLPEPFMKIIISIQQMLLDTMRKMDEWQNYSKVITSFDLVPILLSSSSSFQTVKDQRKEIENKIFAPLPKKEDDDLGVINNLSDDIAEIESTQVNSSDIDTFLYGDIEKKHTSSSKQKPSEVVMDFDDENKEMRRVLKSIDGRKTVTAIINETNLGEFETVRILYELYKMGQISFKKNFSKLQTKTYTKQASSKRLKIQMKYIFAAVVIIVSTIFMSIMEYSFDFSKRNGTEIMLKQQEIINIEFAVQFYFLKNREYPENLHNLKSLKYINSNLLNNLEQYKYQRIGIDENYHLSYISGK